MVNEPIIFRDGVCPECSEMCGNSGVGDTFHCLDCGWTGKLCSEDEAAIQAFFQRSKEREEEARSRMTDHERTTYTQALSKWGPTAQTFKAMEEMAELQKELCKHAEGADNQAKIAEEIADVLITLGQMMILHECEEQVGEHKRYKLERLVTRIND